MPALTWNYKYVMVPRHELGAPLAPNATGIANAVNIATTGQFDLSATASIPDPYGRNIPQS